MQKALLGLILTLVLQSAGPTLADHPDPFPDTITTPNFNYVIHYTNDNPYDPNNVQPGNDLNYFPDNQAQIMADALDNNNAPTLGNPGDYHRGYTDLDFLTPVFPDPNNSGGFIPPQVAVFDCGVGSDRPEGHYCSVTGAAGFADGIRMPATGYIQAPEIEIRRVLGHELFHHVQFAYVGPFIPRTFNAWRPWSIEGTARVLEDKIYSDIDGAPDSKYAQEVTTILGIPNRTLWDAFHAEAAIFWNYLTEQLGQVRTEPQVGVDFIRTFWENAQTNSANPDLVATLRQTISQFEPNMTLEGIFHDFAIANYARDLDLSGLGINASKYRYADENDGTRQTYGPVGVATTDEVPPTITRNDTGNDIPDVVRWGAKYHEAGISPDCPAGYILGFRSDGDAAAYSLLAMKGGNADRVDRLYKSVTDHFARALVQEAGDPYTRLVAVVAGLNDPADYTYTFDWSG